MNNPNLDFRSSLAAPPEALPFYRRQWFWTIRLAGIALLILGIPIASTFRWQIDSDLYVFFELINAGLSLSVAIVIFAHYLAYSESFFLFIGLSFLAASTSDLLRALNFYEASTWIVGRIFLGIFLLISSYVYTYSSKSKTPKLTFFILAPSVAATSALATYGITYLKLPMVISEISLIHRPLELCVALIYLTAFWLYLRIAIYKKVHFAEWMSLSLMLGIFTQIYMSFSKNQNNTYFSLAHLLKSTSYICPLIGIYIDTIWTLRNQEKTSIQLANKSDELSALLEISSDLVSNIDMKSISERVIHKAIELTPLSEAGIMLIFDEETEKLRPIATVGFDMELINEVEISPGEGASGKAFQTGLPFMAANIEELKSIYSTHLEANQKLLANSSVEKKLPRGLIAVPLVSKQHPIGVIVLLSYSETESFSQDDLPLIQTLANICVAAIENTKQYKHLEYLSITDPLTGLFNLRYFKHALSREISNVNRKLMDRRENFFVSLLLFDIDDFKGFNDGFGHPAGDKLLVDLCRAINSVIRKVDIFCRLGGEEFALILPETGKEGAIFVAERIRKTVEEMAFYGNKEVPIVGKTVSLGVATYPLDAVNEENLIAKADQALYKAKAAGKNRVVGTN